MVRLPLDNAVTYFDIIGDTAYARKYRWFSFGSYTVGLRTTQRTGDFTDNGDFYNIFLSKLKSAFQFVVTVITCEKVYKPIKYIIIYK